MSMPTYDRVTGTTDSTGNCTLTFTPPTGIGGYYRMNSLVISCDADNGATYCKVMAGDRIVGFINSGNGQIGPALIQPGEEIIVHMYNGALSTPVTNPSYGNPAVTVNVRADLYGDVLSLQEAQSETLSPVASEAINANLSASGTFNFVSPVGGGGVGTGTYFSPQLYVGDFDSVYVEVVWNQWTPPGDSVSIRARFTDNTTGQNSGSCFVMQLGEVNQSTDTPIGKGPIAPTGRAVIPVLGNMVKFEADAGFNGTIPALSWTVTGVNSPPNTLDDPLATTFDTVKIKRDDATGDAFNRIRVSSPHSLFDSTFEYDLNPMNWDQFVAGSGSVTYQSASVNALLSTGTTPGSRAGMQTHNYQRYQPGKSHLILITGIIAPTNAGDFDARIVYGDDNNGMRFRFTSGIMNVGIYSNTGGPQADIPQNKWNIDRMDGTGPSQQNLSWQEAQLFVIDLQWLSIGTVRFGFYVNGSLYYCHAEHHGNLVTAPYTATANLPVRAEIFGGGTPARTMVLICCTVISEGGREIYGFPFSMIRLGFIATSNVAWTPVCSLRLAATFKGKTNKGLIIPTQVEGMSDNGAGWAVFINPTLTGASWVSPDAESAAQIDTSATAMTGGQAIKTFLSGANTGQSTSVAVQDLSNLTQRKLSLNSANISDILTLAVQRIQGAGSNAWGSIDWLEQR